MKITTRYRCYVIRGGKQISCSLICRLSRGRKFSPSEQRQAGIIAERFHRRKAARAIYANYSSESLPLCACLAASGGSRYV